MKNIHGANVTPDRVGGAVSDDSAETIGFAGGRFDRAVVDGADDPALIAAHLRGTIPDTYHRSINVGWWCAALATGALAWMAILG